MDFNNFHFLRPYWLLALFPLALYLYFYLQRRLKQGSWTDVCDPQLLDWLLVDKPVQQQSYSLLWISIAGIISILALAGPSWEKIPVPVFRNQSALVLALDLSESMDATDVKPNRIARARFKITDILKQRKDGQSALIAYSDAAFVVTPLSNDAETIVHQLNVLEPGLMPAQGNNTTAAMKLATKLFRQAGIANGQVLLVTDGGDQQSSAVNAARELSKHGHQLFVLGIGTEAGAPIPQAGGFLKDAQGSILIPKLDQSVLTKMASAGHGIYRKMTPDNADINQLLSAIDHASSTDLSNKAVSEISQWKDRGPWLVLLLIPIAAFAFRKGSLVVVLVAISAASPESQALSWDDLWMNANQRGESDFAKNQYQQAVEHFDSPQWKAASHYRAGQYDKAAEILKHLPENSENMYNLGNAQAQQKQLKQALKSYDKALQLDPDNKDAQYNKKLVEDALKQQQQQQQDKKDQQNQSEEQSDADNQQQQQSDSKDQQDNQQQSDKQDQQQEQQQSSQESASKDSEQQNDQSAEKNQDDLDEEKQNETEARTAEKDSDKQNQEQKETQASRSSDEQSLDESDQETEQWMRRIPDDPGRLLRRKFLYQYKRRNNPEIR
ncbi:MAG TPA: VWA domain-containing protein [Crenotrichaceae bacterium]|nr:VWA domain-containing protein [Crenotrichaceae bacterium]